MLAIERYQAILNHMRTSEVARVKELADELNVSEVTIRKDLTFLEGEKLITKVHGGAVLTKQEDMTKQSPALPADDKSLAAGIESRLAQYLYTHHIENGDTIFLASGQTCSAVANYVRAEDNISIITNNVDAIPILKGKCKTLILIGGEVCYHEDHIFTTTNNINDYITRYNISKAITSSSSIDMEAGISVSTEASLHVFSAVIQAAKEWFLIVKDDKFDHVSPYKVSDIIGPDYIFTDNASSKYATLENLVNVETKPGQD